MEFKWVQTIIQRMSGISNLMIKFIKILNKNSELIMLSYTRMIFNFNINKF